MFQRIQVIVNPAAGQDEPILNAMNSVFGEAGIEWDVSLTKQAGDAQRLAQEAVAAGVDVVAVYGGDGTVAEVASGLIGSPVPMAILPGGTANVLSVELGIPVDITQACRLASGANSKIRKVDMGLVNEHHFILRVGIGFEAAMVENADRELKNKYGVLAYLWSAVQNLYKPEIAHYRMMLDGKLVETEGLTCIVANSGNLGQAGINLIPGIDVSDGLLDVIVIQQANLRTFFDIVGSIAGLKQYLLMIQNRNAILVNRCASRCNIGKPTKSRSKPCPYNRCSMMAKFSAKQPFNAKFYPKPSTWWSQI